MKNPIEELNEEISSINETTARYKQKGIGKYEIEGLEELKFKLEKLRDEIEAGGKQFKMSCECGFSSEIYNFDIITSVQECEHCGNHIKVEVECPKCKVTKTISKDRQYEE